MTIEQMPGENALGRAIRQAQHDIIRALSQLEQETGRTVISIEIEVVQRRQIAAPHDEVVGRTVDLSLSPPPASNWMVK